MLWGNFNNAIRQDIIDRPLSEAVLNSRSQLASAQKGYLIRPRQLDIDVFTALAIVVTVAITVLSPVRT